MVQNGGSWTWTLLSCISLCVTVPLSGDNYGLNKHWNLCGEFVFMRRSDIHNNSLVKDSDKEQCINQCPNFTVLTSRSLVNQLDYEPGYRIGLTYIRDNRMSFEGNFLWVSEWEGEKSVHGNQSLSFPFKNPNYTDDFNNASKAIAIYKSNFWDVELNFWRHFNPRRVDYFCLSFIAGLRYFHINESFELTMIKPPDKSSYDIHTSNKIFGIQVGLDFQMNPMRWLSWDIFAKVGGMINHAENRTLLRDQDDEITLRDFNEQERELGVFADVAGQFTIYCTNWLNFHAGYEMIFLSGLALAPEQVSKHTKSTSGEDVYVHGDAIIHGLYTGLTFSF